MSANARHSKATPRWGTPREFVAMARVALGGRIGLDPMSEPAFNEVVQAERFYTEQDDCFKQDWSCESMLINPAGGLVVQAWQRLVSEFTKGNVRRAVWIGFSVEQLNLLADEPLHPDDFSKLTVRQRMDFLTVHPRRAVASVYGSNVGLECGHVVRLQARKESSPKSYRCTECIAAPEPNGAPSHANYIVGLGIASDVFECAFLGKGRFHHGRLAISRPTVSPREALSA